MKTPKPKSLAILQANGKQFPKLSFSLLEIMRQFIASEILETDRLITRWIAQTKKSPGTMLTQDEVDGFRKAFWDIFEEQCKENGWEKTGHRVFTLKCLLGAKHPISAESLNTALWELQWALYNELKTIKFTMIEDKKSHYLEQDNLFGEQVSKSFPSARNEIQAAGNCLAMDLNTAAVFHSLRAAEIGMRALAVNLGVKLTHKGKPKRIEQGGWDQIITQIENKIRERHEKYKPAKPPVGVPAPSAKAKKMGKKEFEFLKFCRMMANELFIFKEIWRNNTMHSITSYNESEAKGVFDRVRDFMQRLSSKVSETNR